ncbi:MAG: siderophore-interacting protein [Paracoccus sp. (in: a-proteobacteria)]|uniref:siderophore-interacting protein n=1 Tax=Paracoccus sp. TaxID=267 RepID=UPI0039E672B0
MSQLVALFRIPADIGIPLLCERADALGAHVTREEGGAEVQAADGSIIARPMAGGVELALSAESDQGLLTLRDAIDGFAMQNGFPAPDWRRAPTNAAPKSRLMTASLVGKTRISPSFCRVRLAGDFTAFTKGGLHFRLLLGPEGAAWPTARGEGIDWPGGIDAWHRPPYTVRRVGAGGDWLDFDIFLHEGGRVSEWCDAVAPGARVMLTGPGGRGVKQADWMGIIGDETALPVIMRAIEAASPDAKGEVRILISDPADSQQVEIPAGMVLRWVTREKGRTLPDLLAGLSPPESGRFLFFAGERAEAEAARLWAKEAGLGAGEFHAAAYWTRGWVPPAAQRQARGAAITSAGAG